MKTSARAVPFIDASATLHGRVMARLSRHAGFRLFRFFTRPLEPEPQRPTPDNPAMRLMSESEVLPLCLDPELDLSEDQIRAAYSRGDLCVAAFEANRMIGYCWLAFSPTPHLDGVWAGFAADAVWTYKSLVRRSHRGRHIAPALYRFGDGACVERHRHFSILCVESFNRPSIAAAQRSGYAAAGYAAYLRRHERLFTWYSPRSKPPGVQFYIPPSGHLAIHAVEETNEEVTR